MRILFLTHAFNSLAQRLFLELSARGHVVSIEFDIHDSVTVEAVRLFQPDLIVAPFLKRAIPASVWRVVPCFVVHPGPPGDRGPSSLDRAILDSETAWGVTVLRANGEMDAGDVWASASFPMRLAPKSNLYRNEVTEAAVQAVMTAVDRFASGTFQPERQPASPLRPLVKQAERAIDWHLDSTETVVRKIHAADSSPGVLDGDLYWYGAHVEPTLRGVPGAAIAQRDGAICRATTDGAVWITHARHRGGLKLPTAPADLPEAGTWREIRYEEQGDVGYLHFDFYNGAMSTQHCERLAVAFRDVCTRPTRVIVLMGGTDFWSNGIHLHAIEAADSPADESWRNIHAMDDLTRDVLTADRHLTIAAMQGNAGAGGCFLALAADQVYARRGIVLNPHYKSMGNLYGSEYWTYLLPRRMGPDEARRITEERLPWSAPQAASRGLVDACFGDDVTDFRQQVQTRAESLAADPTFDAQLAAKRARRAADEAVRPLAAYRDDELSHMRLNFYGFDPSYHVARYHFVHRVPHAWTPLHLARHRHPGNGDAHH